MKCRFCGEEGTVHNASFPVYVKIDADENGREVFSDGLMTGRFCKNCKRFDIDTNGLEIPYHMHKEHIAIDANGNNII